MQEILENVLLLQASFYLVKGLIVLDNRHETNIPSWQTYRQTPEGAADHRSARQLERYMLLPTPLDFLAVGYHWYTKMRKPAQTEP